MSFGYWHLYWACKDVRTVAFSDQRRYCVGRRSVPSIQHRAEMPAEPLLWSEGFLLLKAPWKITEYQMQIKFCGSPEKYENKSSLFGWARSGVQALNVSTDVEGKSSVHLKLTDVSAIVRSRWLRSLNQLLNLARWELKEFLKEYMKNFVNPLINR